MPKLDKRQLALYDETMHFRAQSEAMRLLIPSIASQKPIANSIKKLKKLLIEAFHNPNAEPKAREALKDALRLLYKYADSQNLPPKKFAKTAHRIYRKLQKWMEPAKPTKANIRQIQALYGKPIPLFRYMGDGIRHKCLDNAAMLSPFDMYVGCQVYSDTIIPHAFNAAYIQGRLQAFEHSPQNSQDEIPEYYGFPCDKSIKSFADAPLPECIAKHLRETRGDS